MRLMTMHMRPRGGLSKTCIGREPKLEEVDVGLCHLIYEVPGRSPR